MFDRETFAHAVILNRSLMMDWAYINLTPALYYLTHWKFEMKWIMFHWNHQTPSAYPERNVKRPLPIIKAHDEKGKVEIGIIEGNKNLTRF